MITYNFSKIRTIQEIKNGVQTVSIYDIDKRNKNIRSMIRMLMYEIELLDSKMNGYIIYLQNYVNNVTIENIITPIEINNICVGSYVKMVMSDYFIIIDMAFGRDNERGIHISRQPDEINLVVT